MKDTGKRRNQLSREVFELRSQVAHLERERQGRLRAEHALWQYWNLLECILNNTPDFFTLKNTAGRYQAASPAFCRFVGLPEHEIRRRSDFDLFPRTVAEVFHRHDATVVAVAQPQTWDEAISRDDGRHWFRFHKAPLFGGKGDCIGILCVTRDITGVRRAEEQNKVFLRTGGDGFWLLDIHGNILDVDQIYCTISGYSRSELLNKNLQDIELLTTPEDFSLRNRRIMDAGWGYFKTLHRSKDNRILELEAAVNFFNIAGGRFYQFFREITPQRAEHAEHTAHDTSDGVSSPAPSVRHYRVINLNDIVHQALTLQAETLPPGIRIERDLEPALGNICANQPQILQVLMNLVNNAIEAITGRGKIVVSTRNIEITRDLARAFPQLNPGLYVYLSVEDNGRGINNKLISKIFEPFITTKYGGHGMGLASAWRNIKEHGGHITVKSREGYGSTFSVYLPATSVIPEVPSSCIRIPTGTETVLLVDTESYARSDARAMLERLAYRVLPAKSMSEALSIARDFPGRIHLAMLDTRVSSQEGSEILQQLRRERPDMKVILTGTQDLDGPTQDLLDTGAHTFVQKPFRVEVLAPKVRQTLDM